MTRISLPCRLIGDLGREPVARYPIYTGFSDKFPP